MSKIWLDNREGIKEYSTTAIENGYDAIWVNEEDIEKTQELGEIDVVSKKSKEIAIIKEKEDLEKEEYFELIEEAKDEANEVGFFVIIRDKESEEFAKEVAQEIDYLVIRTSDWDIIPLENLIAALQDKDVELIVGVNELGDVETALTTLEEGSDGVLFEPSSLNEIIELSNLISELGQESLDLSKVEIRDIKEVGMGDRVCVDTGSLMEEGEGMLVGSSSRALFLVHSESIDSEYADPRPFRVNAGSVHNYIQVDLDETRYLSELGAGDEVLVVDEGGGVRDAFVGRSKIEKRPMMLVEASFGDEVFSVVLQNAETIRLVTEDGEAVSLADLEKGDVVLAKLEEGGRHFGEKVEETIYEK